MFRKIISKNLTGFQNLEEMVCEIIYLKGAAINFIYRSMSKKVKNVSDPKPRFSPI
jgi:hypothetical protein